MTGLSSSRLKIAVTKGKLSVTLNALLGVQIPIIFSGVTFIVGAAIMAGAVHISMIIIGRIILGLGVGVGSTVSAPWQALHAHVLRVLHPCSPVLWQALLM